ncbi:phosphoenolpyruvate--protein phosphotransferase [uncultured Sphingomonas sp.]|uniref:phosphoenolpyruvate--protein phosphotransferase n=1 Tax=uncultured Sphingomonas sp. TaxID=158754 RepID=UPI0035C95866
MTLALVAPMAGWAGPLAELPDAAFAEGMVGDGLAIDPVGDVLHAPCDGIVVGVHRACHAVTLRADNGAEILCHIGIETVGLGGEGFTALVADGERVAAGAPLLRFDLDTLAAGAKSLASPILVIDTDAFRVARRADAGRVLVGDWLMEIEANGASAVAASAQDGPALMRTITLPLGYGIHARPAVAIVALARGFDAEVALASGVKTAPATSAVALMTLGLAGGERATLSARGPDAEAALKALARLIEHDFEGTPPAATPAAPIRGGWVTAVPGIAVGTIVRLDVIRRDPPAQGQGVVFEMIALEEAIADVRAALDRRATSGAPAQREIARAHLGLLDDPRLHHAAGAAIADGVSAGAAWRAALAPDIAALRAVADIRIAGRADDLLDLEQQVIAATLGPATDAPALPDDAILVAHDLLPSELMALDSARLVGIALAGGGPTSHVAIIAAASGIPMIVALGAEALVLESGARAVLDAGAGTLKPADVSTEIEARVRIDTTARKRADAQARAGEACHMADGVRIEIFANLGSLADAEVAVAAGAEGCGLLRTELLFLDRDTPPDEAEQVALYGAIAERLAGRPLIIRTLDIGGDKPVRYLPIAPEENPALGLRGIRVGLAHPDLLETQIRAIVRAGPPGQCRVLVPMVASLDELLHVRRLVEDAARAIGRVDRIEVGVMIETPAAAITADLLAPAANFFAIGTNDLAQYTLAMDRGNAAVAAQVDALHPAVLRMIHSARRAAGDHRRPVGVCGALASDPVAAPILIGLGVTELSAVPGAIPELKALVRTLTRSRCEALATDALRQTSARAVRALAMGASS